MRRLTNKSTFDLVYCRLSLNPFPRGLLLGLSLIACSSASLNAQANRQPSQMSDEARKGYHEAVVGIVSRLAVDGTPEQYKTVADAYAVRRQYDEAAVYYLTAI